MGNVRAKFFKSETGQDLVEIKIIGDPCDIILKVAPHHIEQFPREWEAFQQGEQNVDYGGTPLTDVPGIDANVAIAYKLKGVHNAEMLANLSDAAALGLGMGGLTARNVARLLVEANKHNPEALRAAQAVPEAPKRKGRPPKVADLREDEPKPSEALSEADLKAADYDLTPIEE